jgi:Fic family protein
MNNDIPQDVYSFLYQHRPKEERKEGDFTIRDASIVWDCSQETARKILNKMAEDGEIERIKYKQGYIFREINT